MGRKRRRLNWTWDDERQEFTTPSGQIVTLTSIAQLLADRIECRHDFIGPWSGWKMRGDALIPPGHGPGAPRLKQWSAKQFAAWVSEPTARPGLGTASVVDLAPRIADKLRPALTLDGLSRCGRSGAALDDGDHERHERHNGQTVRKQMIHGNPLP
jgi:hypothetical protein